MSPEDAIVYLETDLPEVVAHAFCGGTAVVFSRTSPGKETPNEDAAALVPYAEATGILLVADGVGGLRGGSQASSTTAYELCAALEQGFTRKDALRNAILDGIESADREVRTLGIGAGTTLALVEVDGGSIRPYHVGDSQILLLSQRGRQKLLTIPHSPIGYAEQSGLLDEAQAILHEDRHIVSNLVGMEDMTIEIGARTELSPRDTLLIATDGLFDNLKKEEIIEALRTGELVEATAALVARCLERMGTQGGSRPGKLDDLTVITYRVGASNGESEGSAARVAKRESQ